MFRQMLAALRRGARRRAARAAQPVRFAPALVALDGREVPAVLATFSPTGGTLTVFGDAQNNTIDVSRDAAGKILVNGGAVAVVGGTATVANTSRITVLGLGGDDTLRLVETNGALPAANLFGGAGNDVL